MKVPVRYLAAGYMLLALSHCGQAATAGRLDADAATSSQALIAGLQAGTTYKITNKQTGMALDVSGVSVADGAMIWEYAYNGQSNQQWQLQQAPDGNAVLVSLNSNKVLDLPGGSTANGTGLQQWGYWDQAFNQRWALQSDGAGAYFIRNAVSNLCIDAPAGVMTNGTYVQQWSCWSGADNQKWYFTPVGSAPASSAPTVSPTASAPTVANSGLHVSGNTLVDGNGAPVRLHGINIPSLEWGNGEPNLYTQPCWAGQSILDSVKKAFTDYHVNFVRLPISRDRWWNAVDGQGAAYRQTVYDIVNYVTQQGGNIDFDMHVSDMGVWGQNIAQHFMPDDNTATVLADVASQFASNSHVLIGLYNEPHDVDWNTWRDGGEVYENGSNYHTPGIQALVNTVRAAGATNVLIAGGLDWSFDGWLNQHNYNYSAWNLHISSTPAMISDWCYTPTPYFGAQVLPWIAGN